MTDVNDIPDNYQKRVKVAEQLYSTEEIEPIITKMAHDITDTLQRTNPLILTVMIGGLILTGKLIPQLNFPLRLDYIHATRYRNSTTGHELNWIRKLDRSLQGETVLLIDDILDHGITLAAIIDYCYKLGAKKVLTAVLTSKKRDKEKRLKKADFTGLSVPDRYVFGYGMDYQEYHRNSSGIYALKSYE